MTRHDGPVVVPALERATYRAESPIRKVVRSNRLNPLPYAGTISVFLLIVVVVTGVYVTLFFGFGFEASYRSVEKMHSHPVQSVVRTVHRYSSAALVLTTLVHAWRIFVAGRFRGPRRWRWSTGIVSLVVVWLAGVTGYWLVWDRRAQALNEAAIATFGGIGTASSFYVRNVAGPDSGSGWGVMFSIWLVHLLLTGVIGYFIWRHVRRTQLRIMPPRHWMAIMLGALVVVSIILPADLLGRVDQARLVGDLPLDPFILFLLPPMLGGWGAITLLAVAALVVVVAFAPWRSAPTPVVAIDEEACTGCELCVVDCPYEALTMVTRPHADQVEGLQLRRPVAVVDASACVGCGICIGSCSFGAMALAGFESPDRFDPAGRHVVLACSRQISSAPKPVADDVAVIEVACTGMIHANTIGALSHAGATRVQVVGCGPGDCAYGVGNTILDERLHGIRAPHVAKKWLGVAAEDWVAPGEIIAAVAAPNAHPDVDGSRWTTGRRAVGAVAVVAASVVAVAIATRAPYSGNADSAGLLVLVDHSPGYQLEGQPSATGAAGDRVDVVARRDGEEIVRRSLPVEGPTAVGIVDVDVEPGVHEFTVSLIEGEDETELYADTTTLSAGERLVVSAVDVPPPADAADGRKVFESRAAACSVCHSTKVGDDGVGPSLAMVGERAADRVPGLDAEAYLRQSVLDPDAYIVDGFRAGQMLDIYGERLSEDQLDAVVKYLLSLTGEGR